jgi:hypothetical protein
MKGTNFSHPRHGGLAHLTLEELKAVADPWEGDIKVD